MMPPIFIKGNLRWNKNNTSSPMRTDTKEG